MYKENEITVMCKEIPGTLRLRMPKKTGGTTVVLSPDREYVDVQDTIGDPDKLKAMEEEFRRWTDKGYVSWHKKGSRPKPKPIKTRLKSPIGSALPPMNNRIAIFTGSKAKAGNTLFQ